MPTPPGLTGKWRDVIKKKQEYPYRWNLNQKPAGRKGQKCRILRVVNKAQGIVLVEFESGAQFNVVKKGLVKADAQN